MVDFFNKLENLLFDVLGLILPGFILILITTTPLLLFEFHEIPNNLLLDSRLLSTFDILSNHLYSFKAIDRTIAIGVLLLVSYIVGHVVKIFSIIFYEFGTLIFDKSLIKLFDWLRLEISTFIKHLFKIQDPKNLFFYSYYKTLISPIKNTLRKVFTFQSASYFPANESLVKESVKIINKNLNTKYPEVWYSLYKFSVIINNQEKLKSLAGFFLAKYNLYRSLSFLFVISFFYFQIFYSATDELLTEAVRNIKRLILLAHIILWFTFHVKYKRYWTLCGNETLISLYYFLNRDLLRKTEEHKTDAG